MLLGATVVCCHMPQRPLLEMAVGSLGADDNVSIDPGLAAGFGVFHPSQDF